MNTARTPYLALWVAFLVLGLVGRGLAFPPVIELCACEVSQHAECSCCAVAAESDQAGACAVDRCCSTEEQGEPEPAPELGVSRLSAETSPPESIWFTVSCSNQSSLRPISETRFQSLPTSSVTYGIPLRI